MLRTQLPSTRPPTLCVAMRGAVSRDVRSNVVAIADYSVEVRATGRGLLLLLG